MVKFPRLCLREVHFAEVVRFWRVCKLAGWWVVGCVLCVEACAKQRTLCSVEFESEQSVCCEKFWGGFLCWCALASLRQILLRQWMLLWRCVDVGGWGGDAGADSAVGVIPH